MEKVFEIYIRTTPERLWEAITDPDIRAKYNFGAAANSDWKPGSRMELAAPLGDGLLGDGLLGEGEIIEAEPPVRLLHTMTTPLSGDAERGGASPGTWES